MLKFGEEYVERGQEAYEAQRRRRSIDRLSRLARDLGLGLISRETGEILG
jgi:hypothetical protein